MSSCLNGTLYIFSLNDDLWNWSSTGWNQNDQTHHQVCFCKCLITNYALLHYSSVERERERQRQALLLNGSLRLCRRIRAFVFSILRKVFGFAMWKLQTRIEQTKPFEKCFLFRQTWLWGTSERRDTLLCEKTCVCVWGGWQWNCAALMTHVHAADNQEVQALFRSRWSCARCRLIPRRFLKQKKPTDKGSVWVCDSLFCMAAGRAVWVVQCVREALCVSICECVRVCPLDIERVVCEGPSERTAGHSGSDSGQLLTHPAMSAWHFPPPSLCFPLSLFLSYCFSPLHPSLSRLSPLWLPLCVSSSLSAALFLFTSLAPAPSCFLSQSLCRKREGGPPQSVKTTIIAFWSLWHDKVHRGKGTHARTHTETIRNLYRPTIIIPNAQ